MTDDYTIRVLADVLADRTAQLDACIQSATESRDQFQEQLDTAHRLYRDFRRAVQEALGIDRAELLPEDEVVRQVRVVAGQLRQPVTGVIPMGDPWIVPEQDGPPEGDHRTDAITYAKMIERDKTTLADGSQAKFYSDERPDDGPPTESLSAVEDPPAVPDECTIGRVLTRDLDWDTVAFAPLAVLNRAGDWWTYSHIPAGQGLQQAVYNCSALDSTNTLVELLHMHGMLWEVLDASEQQSGVAGQETAVDHGC